MTQIGEKVERGKELEDEEETEKEPLDIRISFFFDGTLNNRTNIAAREKGETAYQEHSNKSDDSYENGRTNIAIMEEQVLTPTEKNVSYRLKVYTEGPGTINLARDNKIGYGMGGGDAGVKSKVQAGIDNAIAQLSGLGVKKEKFYIEKLTLDVFGFSRGAAGARYCVHKLLKDKKNPFIKRVTFLGLDVRQKGVEVKFAGLYDTVASYWLGQMLHTDNWRLELRSIALAKNVIHLAAAEEHRKNFPLHNIKSAKDTDVGQEFFLPGVHSDIGGSYNSANRDQYENEIDKEKKRAMLLGSDSMVLNVDSPRDIEADRDYLLRQGWYRPHEIWSEVHSINDRGETLLEALHVKRGNISSAYSNIPLKIMADFARTLGKIDIDSDLEDKANDILSNESDLGELEDRIKSYVASVGKSSTYDDWLKEDPLLFKVRHDHLHFSAKIKLGLHPRIKRGKRQRYTFDG